jgi:histidine triad (HIT) family protein
MGICAFCEIVSKDRDAHIVFESEECMAFLDARPLFHGHCLVVPKEHVVTVMEATDKLLCSLSSASKKLSVAVKEATESDGVLIINNNIVSQSVPHLHIHVIPRKRGDGLKGFMWPGHPYADEEEARKTAEKIKAALKKE